MRKQGKRGTAIASELTIKKSTVYDWLNKMHRDGLDARYDKIKSGRYPKISPEMYKAISDAIDRQPKGCDIKSNVWTGRLILIMLSTSFGIEGISPSTAYRTMHKMGKSYRMPSRPFDHRTPSKEAKKLFKISLGQKIRDATSAGFKTFWIDESHFSTKTIRGHT